MFYFIAPEIKLPKHDFLPSPRPFLSLFFFPQPLIMTVSLKITGTNRIAHLWPGCHSSTDNHWQSRTRTASVRKAWARSGFIRSWHHPGRAKSHRSGSESSATDPGPTLRSGWHQPGKTILPRPLPPSNRAGGFWDPSTRNRKSDHLSWPPPGRKWSPASWRTHLGQTECSGVGRERSHGLLLLLLAAASRQLLRHLHTLCTAPGDHAGGAGSDVIAGDTFEMAIRIYLRGKACYQNPTWFPWSAILGLSRRILLLSSASNWLRTLGKQFYFPGILHAQAWSSDCNPEVLSL